MFRAIVLSIVLTISVAPTATLLCGIWCHPSAAATDVCQLHGPTPSASLRDGATCTGVVLNGSTFIREGGLQAKAAPGMAAVVPWRRQAVVPDGARRADAYERTLALARGPLHTTLRL